MKFVAILFLALFLGACNSTEPVQLTIEKYRVVEIPESLYTGCPQIGEIKRMLPNYKTLNDKQVATLITRLYKTSISCRNAIDNIRKFVDGAKSEIDGKPIY